VSIICLVSNFASGSLLVVVTCLKTYATVRDARRNNISTPLAAALLRNGVLYFLSLLSLQILGFVGTQAASFNYISGNIFNSVLPAAGSIVITHFLLNLRQIANGTQNDSLDTSRPSFVRSQRASIRFASFVDNMGEQLSHGDDAGVIDAEVSWAGDDKNAAHEEVKPEPIGVLIQIDIERDASVEPSVASGSGGTRDNVEEVDMRGDRCVMSK